MANTKTQKILTISKTKSENIANWFVNDAQWKLLAEHLELGKTAIFKYKKLIKTKSEEQDALYALGDIFTLNQLNTIIELFNDAIEHPEKYEKPKKKSTVDLKAQADVIQKHTKDMNMDYLSYQTKPTATEDKAKIETENKTDKEAQTPTKSDVIAKHNAKRKAMKEEIEALPKDSRERMEKERAYKQSEADRIAEFWDAQKREQEDK
ncbi:hypothetical protein GO660_03170 [Staphylococcus aureus]|nr:hypothetical protein [Staphylococcus aureus]MVI00949.1 hypothetical protein [Staphylococcus aureus]MVI25688.1 hypothetical protein [Staphylococcus aureus]MVI29768.1 hypothetical protein [Staphylococcus aureus]MVI87324.1 hypothetical protein [Staphylococcus aureus]